MDADDALAPEPTIEMVCTVTDPAERQRRLTQAYDLIFGFEQRKSPDAQATLPRTLCAGHCQR